MKDDVLLLNGWGATCSLWGSIIPVLSSSFQINCVESSWAKHDVSIANIDNYIEGLVEQLNSAVHIVAWSMGGLIAIRLATRLPEFVTSIHFISSVPNFVSDENQYAGIDSRWFRNFVEAYEKSPIKTLKNFLVLQAKGDRRAKLVLDNLKNSLKIEDINFEELRYGLDMLRSSDFSEELVNLTCKKFFIHGDHDAVVNIEAARFVAEINKSRLHVIEGAGHVPHVSGVVEVAEIIKNNLLSVDHGSI